ncbi:MAG TPA: xanthine dehydrogenase family protein molybdopterin-binding subunit [Candidatus Acidoferrales bacterium]|nr:xanthine dehydrogenase family protein molybdopterin-binding subunit [Candidatus Acidoferrales bacterium]
MKKRSLAKKVEPKRGSKAAKNLPVKNVRTKRGAESHTHEMRWVGKPLQRREETRLVQGKGTFVDDNRFEGMLHIKMVRSPYAHARVTRVDVTAATAAPGVVCTLTGAEVATLVKPFPEIGPEQGQKIVDLPMGVEKVRYQGEPVAAVVAESAMQAEDAAELVEVDYEPLSPVMDCEAAIKDESILHESAGTNRNWHGNFEYGNVDKAFAKAAHVVEIDRLHFHRFSSTPLENNAVIAEWNLKEERVNFWTNNSFPAFAAQFLSPALGVRIDQMRMQSIDIGGGFGIKITNYPYMALCALASRKMGGRPVKWIETRTEHMLASAHGNERTFLKTRVALDASGVITAIESTHVDDCGAYPRYEPLGCIIWAQVLPGAYRIKNMRIDFSQTVTNKCPVGPNRGYSRMQHLWFLERVMDICGHALGISNDLIRERNYIRKEEFPYTTPNGCVYDSGNYSKMLRIAKQLVGYDEWLTKQKAARAEGRMLGIGIGTTLDSGTNNFGQARIINAFAPYSGQSKAANVKLDIYGEVVVFLGSVPQGQGHETTAAQVVAEVLQIPPEMIHVRPGFDSDQNVYTGHTGTYASQFAVSGLSAIHGAAMKLHAQLAKLAAFAMKAKEKDLEFGVGEQGPEVRVKGAKKSMNYWALANLVYVNNAELPQSFEDITLNCRHVYKAPFTVPDIKRKYGNLTLTYAAQLHLAVIEIDRETYQPKILAYAAVDDCGRAINPLIVEGQVHGCAAHGIGAALMEDCRYGPDGDMLASTFSDYTPITAMNMPDLLYGYLETPSPFSYNGAKGMGEGGAAPVHTICAALQDALYPSGIIIGDSHNTGDSIFQAVTNAKRGAATTNVKHESRRKAS